MAHNHVRRTKIICTLGPESESPEAIRALAEAGMNIARLNFSHGTYEEHGRRIDSIREVERKVGRVIGILLDIKGPKIRTGRLVSPKITLASGTEVILTTEDCIGDENRVFVSYPDLPSSVRPGSLVLLDDGLLELVVEEVRDKDVKCRVKVGGELGERKGVTLPGARVNLPAVTEKDVADIRFGISRGVDFIAASFVRKAADVHDVRRVVQEAGGKAAIIAKVESREGLDNIDEIIEAADGVMVARGDLGVEIPPEEVPLAQKMIIRKCNAAGKPVITATQMLDSMVRNPRPTRAEVTDVANAILDGTDAVMLSGETAVGKYPAEAVRMMSRIAVRVESELDYAEILGLKSVAASATVADAISHACSQAALDLGVSAIISTTQSGATARMVSKYRPKAPIIAVTPDVAVARALTINWGVHPVIAERAETVDQLFDIGEEAALKTGLVAKGDMVAMTAGVRTGKAGSTNLLLIHRIGDEVYSGIRADMLSEDF